MPVKYKKLLAPLIFMLFLGHGFAQKIGTFQHNYGASEAQHNGSSVVGLPDKGFMTAGMASIYGSNVQKILIIRTDSLGRQIWSKTYAGTGTGNASSGFVGQNYLYTAVDLILSPEGNVVVCSNTLGIQAVYLFKINLNGNVIWSKTFPGSNKTRSTLGLYIINVPGGYLLTGASNAISTHGEALIMKTDTSGKILWSNIYFHSGCQGAGIRITPSRDGGYLIGGVSVDTSITTAFSYPGKYLIMKIDKNGKLLWSKVYSDSTSSSTGFESANSIVELPDKSIYVFGQGLAQRGLINFGATLMKMDSAGNLLWSKIYYSSNIDNIYFRSGLFDSVKKTINISCEFETAKVNTTTLSYQCGVIRLDSSGKIIFGKALGPSTLPFVEYRAAGHDFLHLSSGSFVMIQYNIVTLSQGYNLFLVKMDSGANSDNCNTSLFSISPSNYPVNYLYSYKDTSVSITPGSGCTVANVTLSDSLFCNPFIADFGWKNPCTGNKTQFLDSSYSGATNWKWDFRDSASSASSTGSDTSSKKNPTHVYAKPGTYIVKLVSGNGQVKDSLTKTITIYQSPVQIKYFDTLICGGNTVQLHTTGAPTYLWKPGNYTTDTTPKITLKKTTTFIVEAIATNACITNDTVHVTVNHKPDPPVIQYTTVKSYKEIDVSFLKSDSNDVKNYIVYRSDNGLAYKEIDTVANLTNSKIDYVVADTTVKADSNNYAYKIVDIDSCVGGLDTSTAHQPVLLKGNPGERRSVLDWTKYAGYAFDTAIVQRYDTITHKWVKLAYLGNTDSGYVDSSYLKCNKTVFYRIETLLKNKQISYSDSIPVTPYETVFKDTPQIVFVTKTSTSATNGTVLIKWVNNNIHLFYNQLYYSTDGTTFTLLKDNIPVGQDSFVHKGVNTQSADQFYYIIGVDSCPAKSPKSITHKTITLTVSIGELLHKLNWTPYEGFKIKRYIIKKLVGISFVAIDSVSGTDTSTKYFPAPCNHVERYMIEAIGYNPGEISFSDSMGRKALDTIPPDAPVIQNATVINGTVARLDFKGSDSLATYKFVIEHSIDGNWTTIGNVPFTGPGQSVSFMDSNINTIKNHICYTVIAIDSCLNSTPGDTFCLINLNGSGEQMADSLHWSPFVGYGLNDYVILGQNNSGVWDTIGTVNQGDTDYFNTIVQCSTATAYKIAGKEKAGNEVSFSNTVTITPFDTVTPPAPELYYATVLPNQTVKLSWQWNPKSIIKYFEVWRGTNHKSPILIDSVTADSIYIDKAVDVKDSLYSYSVIAIDSCNTANRSKHSNTDSLMQLKLYSLYCSPQVQVHWTGYSGATSYNVLRATDGINFASIGTVNASATAYIDTSVVIGKQYYYKTEAIDGKSGYVSFSDTLGIVPRLIPLADSAQLVYATVLKSDETNGEIYIQWKRALRNDTNARGYYVYSYNTANGKYALIKDVTDLNDTSYIQNNINTLQNAYKYYILTYNVCDVGINSKIHKTILLSVQNQNLSELLNWTNYFGISIKTYSVYKSEDGGAQFLVNNAGLDSIFSDSNVSCNQQYTYQIQAMLANGEVSFSDSITVKSFDTITPRTGQMIVATVTKTGTADGMITLMWNAATDNNLEGYNIYRSVDGVIWQEIRQDFVGLSLIDIGLNTYRQSYYYKIQPIDSCGNTGPFTIYHESIQLTASAGNGFNQLSWNGYAGWKVSKYLLYRNGTLIDTLANNVFAFKDTAIICQTTYQYLVKGIDSLNDTIISTSNTDSAKALNHIPPQKVYIKTVTVSKPNKEATISWTASKSYDVKNYFIYRKNDSTGSMVFVDSTTNLSYSDSNLNLSPPLGVGGSGSGGDCYYVFARDHCGNQSDASNQGCIIILNATNQQGYNQLSWNCYQHWIDGVQSYNVYKNEDSTGWQLIGTTSSVQVNEFKDSKLGDSTIDFCYQVEAIENPGQYNQLSRSTVECVHQDATVFIPNTFTPYNADGVNDYFAPQGVYIKSYDMKIYNRWGEMVYKTSPNLFLAAKSQGTPGGEGEKGWDGTYKGQPVQQGVYIYLITVTDYNGKQSYFKGTITMFE